MCKNSAPRENAKKSGTFERRRRRNGRRQRAKPPTVMRYVTHYLRATMQEIAGMKRGPKPIGDYTMTPAERQAR